MVSLLCCYLDLRGLGSVVGVFWMLIVCVALFAHCYFALDVWQRLLAAMVRICGVCLVDFFSVSFWLVFVV